MLRRKLALPPVKPGHQVKQNLQAGQESLDRVRLANFPPEGVQSQNKAYGLLLAMTVVYYRATWL